MPLDLFLLGLIAASLIVIFLGCPVAFALGGCGLIYLLVQGFPITQAAQELIFAVDKFTIIAIPLFMLAGQLMNAGRITDRIFDFAQALVGRIPGGLGHVNVVSSLIFSGMSGSVLADVAGLGAVEVRAMKDKGYDEDFSVGITLASSVVGPIFPPSIPLVLYGITAQVSILQLFLGGVVPAMLIAACLTVWVFVIGKRRRYYSEAWPGLRGLGVAFVKAVLPMLTPVIIVGGMSLGIFSPTEGAVVAVLYALLLSTLVYREIGLAAFLDVVRTVTESTAKLLFIIATALLFGWALTIGQVPQMLAEGLAASVTSAALFLLMVNIALIVLGAVIENAILLLILAPMLSPVAEQQFGIDPVHFGVVMVFNIMIGQFTPPMGLSLFVMRDVMGWSLWRVARAVCPFLIPLVTALLIMSYFPTVVTGLPRMLGFS